MEFQNSLNWPYNIALSNIYKKCVIDCQYNWWQYMNSSLDSHMAFQNILYTKKYSVGKLTISVPLSHRILQEMMAVNWELFLKWVFHILNTNTENFTHNIDNEDHKRNIMFWLQHKYLKIYTRFSLEVCCLLGCDTE